jgi:hypothetical protein
MAINPYANQQSGNWNQYSGGGGGSGMPNRMVATDPLGGLYQMSWNDPKVPVETRLDWKELNKFSLYTPILRVIGDTARKCGAEARFVQTENSLEDCAELMIELRRAGDSTLLDFNTLVQMIEDQGTLAADFSGVRRIVEVTCALLPNPKPQTEEEDSHQTLMAAAAKQLIMAQHLPQALQGSTLRGALGMSPAKQEEWGIDRIKAFLGLKP